MSGYTVAIDVYVNCAGHVPRGPIGHTQTRSRRLPASQRAQTEGQALRAVELRPGGAAFSSGNKARDKEKVAALADELDGWQDLFYADRRFKLLVVLQGTDTSGKDGTIRGVF